MKYKWIVFVAVLLLTCSSCNRVNDGRTDGGLNEMEKPDASEETGVLEASEVPEESENPEDVEASETPNNQKSYTLGQGRYVDTKIPLMKVDVDNDEYYRIMEYEGDIRAIVCDNGAPEDYDEDNPITNVQLYILDGNEWKADAKWTLDAGRIIGFCHDLKGDLYTHYMDTNGDRTIEGSILYALYQNGEVEKVVLEDKDIAGFREKSTIERENGSRWKWTGGRIHSVWAGA